MKGQESFHVRCKDPLVARLETVFTVFRGCVGNVDGVAALMEVWRNMRNQANSP